MRYQYYYGCFSSFCSWDTLHYCNCLHFLKVTYPTVTCLTSSFSGVIESSNTSLHGSIYPSKPIPYMCDGREHADITLLQMAQQVSPLNNKTIIKPFTSNTSCLLYMRLYVSAIIGPSSGLLKNQICKCCAHAGIPTMLGWLYINYQLDALTIIYS